MNTYTHIYPLLVHYHHVHYHNKLLRWVRTFVQWLRIYLPCSEHEELTKIGDLSDGILRYEEARR